MHDHAHAFVFPVPYLFPHEIYIWSMMNPCSDLWNRLERSRNLRWWWELKLETSLSHGAVVSPAAEVYEHRQSSRVSSALDWVKKLRRPPPQLLFVDGVSAFSSKTPKLGNVGASAVMHMAPAAETGGAGGPAVDGWPGFGLSTDGGRGHPVVPPSSINTTWDLGSGGGGGVDDGHAQGLHLGTQCNSRACPSASDACSATATTPKISNQVISRCGD